MSRNDTLVIGKSLVTLEKTEESKSLKYGDILLVYAEFDPISSNGNPLEFDYGAYLRMFDIHHQSYINKYKWQKIGNSKNLFFNFTYGISSYLGNLIDNSILATENKSIAKALLLGQKEDLDKDTLRTYSSAGAMHVLAVSGLHVGIIMYILMFVLKPTKRIKYGKQLFLMLVLFGVWFYAFITGLSPSVLRSSLMFSFIIIGKEVERETSIYQSIMVSAFILILIDPLVIFKVGFQLSYLAVIGIVYLQPKIYNLLYTKYKFFDYLWSITSVSFAAQIATFPLGLFYFHQFPKFFFISNLVVIPLAGFILAIGVCYFLLHLVPIISGLLIRLLDIVLTIMNFCVKWVEELPDSTWWGISITWYETVIIYFGILFAVFAFSLKRSKLLIYSGLTTVLILGSFMLSSYKTKHTNEIIIYNIKDEIAIDIYYGSKNLFLASKELNNDENKLLFHIQHYWHYKGGKEGAFKHFDITRLKSPILSFNSNTYSILDRSINSETYSTNYVVIGQTDFISQSVLNKWKQNNTTLIIHPSCSYTVKGYLRKNYPSYLQFIIADKGAFITTFSF